MDTLMSTFSTFTPFLTANFLPRFLASSLIRFLDQASHNTPLQALWRPAAPGTKEHALNWKKALSVVLVSYFIYNSHASYSSLTSQAAISTPYSVLGVPINVNEAGLRTASRQMALAYHPDRRPNDVYAEEMFVRGREAGDLLSERVMRNGYDRFGPSLIRALQFNSTAAPTSSKTAHTHTTREIFHLGLVRMGWWWLQVAGMQIGMGYFIQGGLDFSKIYILLLSFFIELSIILRPTSSSIPRACAFLLPHLLPFQVISLLHSLTMSSLITIPQLLALWSNEQSAQPAANNADEETQRRQLEGVLNDMKTIVARQEVRTWIGLNDMVAKVGQAGEAQGLRVEDALKSELEEVMIDRAFKENPGTAALWSQALARHAVSRGMDNAT